MNSQKTVLCVITTEQYKEYEVELGSIYKVGAEIVVESSPGLALSLMGQLAPSMVFVGMNLEEMEGLEFLAMLMRKYPQYDRPVILLPEKGDDLPPIIHSRSVAAGRSAVESVDFEYLARLLAETPVETAAGAPEPTPTPSPEPDSEPEPDPEPELLESSSVTGAFQALSHRSIAVRSLTAGASVSGAFQALSHRLGGAQTAAGRRKNRALLLIGVVGGLAAVAVVACLVLFAGGAEEKAPGGDLRNQAAAVTPSGVAAGNRTPVVPEPAPPKGAAKGVEAPAEAADKVERPAPGEPTAAAQPEEMTLPLTFGIASGSPQVADTAKLDEIVARLQERRELQIEIIGHTSSDGEAENNATLGTQRAAAAMKILVRRGVSPQRIVLKSIGGRAPVASNESDEGRSQNRRVTVRLVP